VRLIVLLALLRITMASGDIARVFVAGKEPAIATTTLTVPAVAGHELAAVAVNGKEPATPEISGKERAK
jgi:hypothetical protein